MHGASGDLFLFPAPSAHGISLLSAPALAVDRHHLVWPLLDGAVQALGQIRDTTSFVNGSKCYAENGCRFYLVC
jgi:hypothetical protein